MRTGLLALSSPYRTCSQLAKTFCNFIPSLEFYGSTEFTLTQSTYMVRSAIQSHYLYFSRPSSSVGLHIAVHFVKNYYGNKCALQHKSLIFHGHLCTGTQSNTLQPACLSSYIDIVSHKVHSDCIFHNF